MSKTSVVKKERQNILIKKIEEDPFLTDEEIANYFSVSIPTIRLDRLELGIPELRERVKSVARKNLVKVKTMHEKEMVGELIDINLGKNGISIIETDSSMAFEKTKIIKGSFIYSFAESLAMAAIDAHVALVGVANIKYKIPVYEGSRLIAKAEVRRIKGNNYLVWVKIFENKTEVFRGKFILVTIEDE